MSDFDRGYYIMNIECIVVNSSTNVSDIDMRGKAVAFSGGAHDITGKVIGGQILVSNGAIVYGKDVTIDNEARKTAPRHMVCPILPKQNWLCRLLKVKSLEYKLIVRSPIIVMGASSLSIPDAKVLSGYKYEDAYMAYVDQRSYLDARNANFIHL